MSGAGGEKDQGDEAASKISSMMQPLPRPLFYSRRIRSSRHSDAQRHEKMLRAGSDQDLKLKSISCEPTTEKFEVDEEMEGQGEEHQQQQEEEHQQQQEEEEEEEEEDEDEEEEKEEDEDEENEEDSMESEKKKFARHRYNWEFRFGKGFEVSTLLSPMLFTHCTPGSIPFGAVRVRSLQIYSIKFSKIKHLKWPLDVYGVVAARDYVDNKRNILFFRARSRYQTLTKNNPYLHLTGPCRAIMSAEPVEIEIELNVKGQSEDRALISQVFRYRNPSNIEWLYSYLSNQLCKMELCFEQLERSCQATVMGVRAIEGSPFKYGGRVVCCTLPWEDPCRKVVLFDSKHGTMPMESDGRMCMESDGYLDLSRCVVSVQAMLKVFIHTYSRSGAIHASGRAVFKAKECQISKATCVLHNNSKPSKGKDSKVKITVAWSRLVTTKSFIEFNCVGKL